MDEFSKAELLEVSDAPERCGLSDTLEALVKLYGREAVIEAAKELE